MSIDSVFYDNNLSSDYRILKLFKKKEPSDKINLIIIDDFYGGSKFLFDIYTYIELYFQDYINKNYYYLLETSDEKLEIKKTFINDTLNKDVKEKKKLTLNLEYNDLFNNLIKKIEELKKIDNKVHVELFFFLYKSIKKNDEILSIIKELNNIKNLTINGINMVNSSINNLNINLEMVLNTNVWINIPYNDYNNLECLFKNNILLPLEIKKKINIKIDNIFYNDFPESRYFLINNKSSKIKIKDDDNENIELFFENKKETKLSFFIHVLNGLINNVKNNKLDIYINIFRNLKKTFSELSYKLNSQNNLRDYNKYLINNLNKLLLNLGDLIIKKLCKNKLDKEEISDHLYNLTIKSNSYLINDSFNLIDRIIENLKNYTNKPTNNNFNEKNKKIEKSSDFITSFISLTNWVDEIDINSSMGLILKINSPNFCKLGIGYNLALENVTTSFFPYNDYILTLNNYLNKNFSLGDINGENIIFGNAIGNGNCIIPIYICKKHWKKARKDLNNMLGIICSHNPFANSKNNFKSLFKILIDMSSFLFFSDEIITSRLINCFFLYFRTCSELCFEFKYNRGIKTLIEMFIKHPKKKIMYDQSYYSILLGQMLSTGYFLNSEKLNMFIEIIIEELIRINIKEIIYPSKIVLKNNNYNLNLNSNKCIVNYHLKMLLGYLMFSKVLQKLLNKLGSYNKLIKMLDSNYGILDESILNYVKKNIEYEKAKINKSDIFKYIYSYRKMKYNKNIIIKYLEYGCKFNKNKKIINLINKEIK